MSKISFVSQQSNFFRVLKDKVDGYFKSNDIASTGNTKLFLKGIYQLVSAASLYFILVFLNPPVWIACILCVLFGLNLAIIGFNIMHEGVHQSFSKYKWINSLSAYCLNALGGSSYYWKVKHNINHHTYTNIKDHDHDIDVEPLMRLNENQKKRSFHKFQHLYFVLLYGVSYLSWIFYYDFQKYFSGKIAEGTSKKRLETKEQFIFWTTKVTYIAVYLLLPILMVGVSKAIIGFLIVTIVCGLFIALVFQLAHIVEETSFPVPDSLSNKIKEEWAIHQLSTTANFGTKNKTLSWILGGLNFQIEHHLFPKVSHIHYPEISRIVKETCKEFNITYIEFKTVFKAFKSHFLHIRQMGKA